MMDQFFTWDALATIGGASLFVFFFVQYTKGVIDKFKKFPTDIYVVLVSFMVLLAANLANGANPWMWETYFLTFANSFLVAAASSQIQNKSVNPPGSKKDGE